MAFGDYATLVTQFTGADESPLSDGGNWHSYPAGHLGLQRVSDKATSEFTGGPNINYGQAYYSGAFYGPDVEAYVTVPAVGASKFIGSRLKNPDANGLYYRVKVDGATWRIQAIFSPAPADSYDVATGTQAIGGGDKIGIRIQGFTIDAWWWNAAAGSPAWAQILSGVDTLRFTPSIGYVSLGADNTATTFDDLYAGTIPSRTGVHILPHGSALRPTRVVA